MFLPFLLASPPCILSSQAAPKTLPLFLLMHGEDPSSKAAFPLLVEIEIQIKAQGPEPREKSFTWKGEWKGFGKDVVEPLGDLTLPKDPGPGKGEAPMLECLVKVLSITDSKGKAILRMKGMEGPKVVLGRKTMAMNFRISCVWKADGKLKFDLDLDPLE